MSDDFGSKTRAEFDALEAEFGKEFKTVEQVVLVNPLVKWGVFAVLAFIAVIFVISVL